MTFNRLSAAAMTIALTIALAPAADATTTPSHETRMREFRQMIVGLYGAPREDPLDTLRRSLIAQYGGGCQPMPSRRAAFSLSTSGRTSSLIGS
ncbi:hypothetical protein [Solirubrobacter soli]|uniref:hypothetical protein n=1 Tax=Solirubrobacter soli TaxID=363832 RepID=UPI000482474F|nr:hypothetical protein [Solirubrobacter soli]